MKKHEPATEHDSASDEEVKSEFITASQSMNWGDPENSGSESESEEVDGSPGKLLLYFHGNGEDLGTCYFLMSCFKRRLGVRVLAMEYPGYGLYGYASKDSDQLLRDALTVFDFAMNVLKVRESDIFVFGRSIGSSVATYLAKYRNPCFCVLMSPFKSLKQAAIAVVGSLLASLVAERLNNAEMLRDVTIPVFIVHGVKDELIPYTQAEALLECCNQSRFTYLLLPPEMTHNRFNVEQDLVKPLQSFLHQARLDLKIHKAVGGCSGMQGQHVRTRSGFLPIARKTVQTDDINGYFTLAAADHGRMTVD